MSYLISIVVPTKNRYNYLKHLINLINGFNLHELELVIQDNSDDNSEILLFLANVTNENIKYYYSSEELSMSQNCNLGIKNSTGEYVSLIGDDDGVCRNIVDCVKFLKEENIDVARSSFILYYWGDFNMDRFNRNFGNSLQYKTACNGYDEINVIKKRKQLFKKGFQYVGSNVPGLYGCIVRRSILEKIISIGGTCFPGPSPDISVSICLCFTARKYVNLHYPVIIPGTSKMTGGGVIKKGKHILSLKEVNFITVDMINNWEPIIPKIWCGKYAWAESAIKSVKYMGKESCLFQYNHNYMLANSVVFHKTLFNIAIKYSTNKFAFIYYIFEIVLTMLKNKIQRKIVSSQKVNYANDISDIEHAESYIYNVIIKNIG